MADTALPPRPTQKRKPLTDVSNTTNTTQNTRKSLRLQQPRDVTSKPSMIPMVSRSTTNLSSISEYNDEENNTIEKQISKPSSIPSRRQTMILSASVSALPTLKSTRRQSTATNKQTNDTAIIDNYKQQIESLTTELSDEKQLTTDLEQENTSLLSTIEQLQNKLKTASQEQPVDHSKCINEYNNIKKRLDDKIAELSALNEYNNMLEQQVTELQNKIDQSILPTQKAARSKRLSMLSSSFSSLAAVKEAEDNNETQTQPAAAKRQTRRSSMITLPNCFEPITLNKNK